MRLLFVITRADTVGGAQVHVRDLAARLTAEGHAVLVVTGPAGPYTEALEAAGIEHVAIDALRNPIRPWRDWVALAHLRDVIRRFRPELISAHSSKAGVLARLAGRLEGVPCLFTAHGWAFTTGIPEPRATLYRLIERAAAPLSPRIICVSEYDRRLGIESGFEMERLVAVHNGMPDVALALQARPEAEPATVIMVARHDEQKDHRTLLAALRDLPGARVDLVGDGPGLDATIRLIEAHGMGDRVRVLGRRADVAELLSQAQIFALISNWEGFPNATLEAMRAGLPCVVSDVGGSAEAVEDGKTGFLVPRGDVEATRDRLARLLESPSLRREMGAAARARYEASFTLEHMLARNLHLYRQLASPRAEDRG